MLNKYLCPHDVPGELLQNGVLIAVSEMSSRCSYRTIRGHSLRTDSAPFRIIKTLLRAQVVGGGEAVRRKGNFPLPVPPLCVLELPRRAGV